MSTSRVILVVEDNDDDVYFMRRALRATGATADLRFVGDGKSALQYLRAEGEFADRLAHPLPALTFLDLKLPFVHGLDVLAAIRADPSLSRLRVYVLTSSSEERDRERAMALGIEGYLVKPPTQQMLQPILVEGNGGAADDACRPSAASGPSRNT